jgi:hypothetical protein
MTATRTCGRAAPVRSAARLAGLGNHGRTGSAGQAAHVVQAAEVLRHLPGRAVGVPGPSSACAVALCSQSGRADRQDACSTLAAGRPGAAGSSACRRCGWRPTAARSSLPPSWPHHRAFGARCRHGRRPTPLPASRYPTGPASRVCQLCPVQTPCLRWALDTGQVSGIWGGTTEEERRALLRAPARR